MAVAGRRPHVTVQNADGVIAVVARVRAVAVIAAGISVRRHMHRHVPVVVRSRSRMRLHVSLGVRSRMYMCASPPTRSHLVIPNGMRWMATGSRQRRAAMIMVVALPSERINRRPMPAPARRGRNHARIAARKCQPCSTVTNATTKANEGAVILN